MISSKTIRKLVVMAAMALCSSVAAWSQPAYVRVQSSDMAKNGKISILTKVGIDQHLNQQVPLGLTFTDENGQQVQLQKYFGTKPVILSLVYYRCPMLCSQVMDGMASALKGIVRFDAGRDFTVITVSFDPRDTPQDAREKKELFVKRYGRPDAAEGWHFLTGKKDQIDALATAVGFRYTWDPAIKQFAHATGIMLLTPDGRLAQYYYGIEYPPRDIQYGLIEASKGKIGSLVDAVVLYCYHYDPAKGKYGPVIFNILRLSALATVLVLGGFMIIMFRRDILAARRSREHRTAE